MSKKESDKKSKMIQEKCNTILAAMLRDEDNKYCCDCDSKGPRWASWNIGIFLCIRCAGIHRNLGVHISRVKSVNLDTWLPEQVVSLQQMGNSRARAVYEALLSDNFRRPQTDSGLESFIRAKYEAKKYIAKEWIAPPPITRVDWDKEIDEEIENQKRKKKMTTTSTPIPEATKLAPSPVNVAIPAPPHSPKNPRIEAKKTVTSNSMDLLGLDTSAPAATGTARPPPALADGFDFFANIATSPAKVQIPVESTTKVGPAENSLAQEEDDFFNQKTIENGAGEKGKLTKDSILALYGNAPSYTPPQVQQFNGNFQQFSGAGQDPFFSYGQQPGAPLFKPVAQPSQPQQFGSFGFGGTMQTQQINKLNEENIKKIESLNFNNFK